MDSATCPLPNTWSPLRPLTTTTDGLNHFFLEQPAADISETRRWRQAKKESPSERKESSKGLFAGNHFPFHTTAVKTPKGRQRAGGGRLPLLWQKPLNCSNGCDPKHLNWMKYYILGFCLSKFVVILITLKHNTLANSLLMLLTSFSRLAKC